MSDKNYFTPAEILDVTINVGITKTSISAAKQFLLGILGGAFIALAGASANMAAFNLLAKPETFGLGKLVSGAVFPVGLMLVVIAGGELFTGNSLIFAAVLDGKTRFVKMLQNWFLVYVSNFVGAFFVVAVAFYSGQYLSGNSLLGGVTVKIAYGKIAINFFPALFSGILCNWLVSLGVWLAYAAKDIVGKIFACFFPVFLFVIAGYEHSIANMYYVPAGILAKSVPSFVVASGIPAKALVNLNWQNFFIKNLIPVTIGNIIGGSILIAFAYWLAYKKMK
ncbi:MAG: formate/nitrite transporter family protein [Treponemataceae bacterium]